MQRGNLYQNLPPIESEESFETLMESENSLLERIVSTGHQSDPETWLDQDREEWVVLLGGQAQILFEGDEHPMELQPGDWLLIPAHQRHRVLRTQKDPRTIWLAFHYPPILGS